MDASLIVHSGSPALVGRDMELAVLREGLEQARAGRLRVVCSAASQASARAACLTSSCVYLASGRADGLSGRYIDVYLDIEELVQRVAEVRERDLFTLRMLTE